MLPRNLLPELEAALARQAAVALLGPRQVGKTTLALQVGEARAAVYLDLEDPDDRARLAEPGLFFAGLEGRLVILDEIHRMPELFASLRGVIDQGRRSGQGKGRFLILGSAAIDLLRQSETLAGRIAYLELSPFSVQELPDTQAARDQLWLRGGFPDAYLAASDAESLALRRDFIRTYLERDIPQFGPRIPAASLERLWTLLAHHQGALLNASQLARALELSAQTVTRYIDLLVDLLLVRRLPPLHTNVAKRLVRSPKVYIRDSGLVHALLGIGALNSLLAHPVQGHSWEGMVIESLLAAAPWGTRASFYRTSAGAEIDLILEFPNQARWAIQIKRSKAARPTKGYHLALQDLKPERAWVVHAGDGSYPLGEGIEAVGINALTTALRGLAEASLG